jgi:hypothetical protein
MGMGNAGGFLNAALLPRPNVNLADLVASDMALRFALARGLGSAGLGTLDGPSMPQLDGDVGQNFSPI